MSKNYGRWMSPLYWVFFWDEALEDSPYFLPLLRPFINNLDRNDSRPPGWSVLYEPLIGTNYDGHSPFTRGHAIGYVIAEWVQYAISIGATRNDQLAVSLHFGTDDYVLTDPDDALDDGSDARERATLRTTNGVANIRAKISGWAQATADRLAALGISLRPAFCLMDEENTADAAYIINGSFSQAPGNGNLDEQLAESWASTETLLHANANAIKGGLTNRTLADLEAGFSSYTLNTDWRSAGNQAASSEILALNFMAQDDALAEAVYNDFIAAFPTSYQYIDIGGQGLAPATPGKCGNYRICCADDEDFPLYLRQAHAVSDGSRRAIVATAPTDVYGHVQCPLLYPEKVWWESDPSNQVSNFAGSHFGATAREADHAWVDANVAAVANSSVFDPDLTVPWVMWPDIGNGHGGNYANGYNYGNHVEDTVYRLRRMNGAGIWRAIIWSWNPITQVAADTDTLIETVEESLNTQWIEQAVFYGLKEAAVADTGSGGLFESSGSAYLTGGFRLEGESERTRAYPRIDVQPVYHGRMDASDVDIWSGLWRMRVMVQRDRAFGTGDTPEAAGQLSAVMDRVEAVFDKVSVDVPGYDASTLSISRSFRGPETPDVVSRIVEFNIVAHE